MTELSDRPVVDAAIAEVEGQFSEMFTRVKLTIRDRAARVHPELQPLAYNILTTLARCGPTHSSALAEMLSLDKSIVSRQATVLEELGLLERQPDSVDRRAIYLAATADASARIAELRRAEQGKLYESLRDWQLPDLQKLGELLARLNGLAES